MRAQGLAPPNRISLFSCLIFKFHFFNILNSFCDEMTVHKVFLTAISPYYRRTQFSNLIFFKFYITIEIVIS